MNILVLDGNQNQAVASVRSLARAGHTVFAGEAASWSKAGWSRACSGTFRYPSPQGTVHAFVEAIAAFVRERPGTLVLPMTEATTLPLSAHRDFLVAAGARLVLPDHTDLLRAFDKNETTRLAASLGVAVPKTLVVTSPEQARDAAQSMRYPVVLKPHASEELSPDGKLRTTGRPRYASDSVPMHEAAYREISSRSSAVLVQEFVEGEGTGYFALMHHGELRAEFAHRRIRDVYPTGSGSAVRESVAVDPEIRRGSLAILSALRWHGVAMVEYRKKDGLAAGVYGSEWTLLAFLAAGLLCGRGFSCAAGRDGGARGRSAERQVIVPAFVAAGCWAMLGTWSRFGRVRLPATRASYPGRLSTLLQVLTPVPGTYHDLFQWRDPLPELADWLEPFPASDKDARQPKDLC